MVRNKAVITKSIVTGSYAFEIPQSPSAAASAPAGTTWYHLCLDTHDIDTGVCLTASISRDFKRITIERPSVTCKIVNLDSWRCMLAPLHHICTNIDLWFFLYNYSFVEAVGALFQWLCRCLRSEWTCLVRGADPTVDLSSFIEHVEYEIDFIKNTCSFARPVMLDPQRVDNLWTMLEWLVLLFFEPVCIYSSTHKLLRVRFWLF